MTKPRIPVSETRSSIYRGADGRWHGKVTVGRKPSGEAIRLHRNAPTRAEVMRKVRELETQRDAGVAPTTTDSTTLEVWLERWLERVVAVNLEPKTHATYSSHMRVHVIPELGKVRLRDLTTEMVEDMYASMVASGAGEHTVHGVHRTLRSALSEAVARKHVPRNPVAAAAVTEPDDTEVDPLEVAECQRMLLQTIGTRNAARWSVALALGLRQGEALGLRWSDLDLKTGELRVRKQVQRVKWKHGCGETFPGRPRCGRIRGGNCPDRHSGGLMLRKLKSKPSRRDIQVPQALLEELRAHRQEQLAERLAATAWEDQDLVFSTPTGGYIDPKHDQQEWHRLRDAAGVRHARLHDARHSAATYLLVVGVHPVTALEIMGWSEMRTLRRYTHVVAEVRREAASRIGGLLWPASDAMAPEGHLGNETTHSDHSMTNTERRS